MSKQDDRYVTVIDPVLEPDRGPLQVPRSPQPAPQQAGGKP